MVVSSGGLARLAPIHVTMGRLAAGIRGSVAVVAVAAVVIGTAPPLSWLWVAPTLLVFSAWSGLYAVAAWTGGVRHWLALADLAAASALCLALGKLVPPDAQQGTSWVGVAASMTVILAQFAGSALLYLPAGFGVAACFYVGSLIGDRPENALQYAITMSIQAVAGAAVMQIAVRAGGVAARAFDDLQRVERDAERDMLSRADQLAQMRFVAEHGE